MGSGDKSKPDGDKSARSPAQTEALALVAQLEKELAKLSSFVAEEKKAAKRKAPSPKRLARLRLVSDDVGSASDLSTKSVKG